MSGIWGLTWVGEKPTALDVYAYPPPYLDVRWGEWLWARRLLEEAKPLRGPGWMPYVKRLWPTLHRYLEGRATLEEARRAAEDIDAYLSRG